jgi:hypothetical protein
MVAPAVVGRRVHLVGPLSGTVSPFEEIYALDDPHWARVAFDAARALQRAVAAREAFDLDDIARYAGTQQGWGVAARYAPTLSQERDKVGEMIARVQTALHAYVGAPLEGRQREQFNATIAYAFVNLATQRGAGWLRFAREAGTGARYRYHLLFALQNRATGAALCLAPVLLHVDVDRDAERAQLLTVKDDVSLRVRIDALKLFLPRLHSGHA